MGWSLLVIILVIGAIAALLLQRRRQRRLTLTEHTVRCPVNDCAAVLAVHTDSVAYPSHHRDVIACSLVPGTSYVPPPRRAYFSDMTPPESYVDDVGQAPQHSAALACSKHCLFMLNAAEMGGHPEAIRCTSGVSDALELARQVQSPALTRLMWFHSA